MEGYFPVKMKRKDLEDVNDEFSDFSLSSPARKIRRLDAELPPIMEEDEVEILQEDLQSMPASNVGQVVGGPVIEELPTVPENEERAIVLFKPMNTPLIQAPLGFSVSFNPELISEFKNQVLWSSHSDPLQSAENEVAKQGRKRNEHLAVVPWVPSQFPTTSGAKVPQVDASVSMEPEEEMEAAAMMDIEDNNVSDLRMSGGTNVTEGLHQWPQQHCMIPQPPQNQTTPLVWFR